MTKKQEEPNQTQPQKQRFTIDGFEITASFAQEEQPTVLCRVKEILLAAAAPAALKRMTAFAM